MPHVVDPVFEFAATITARRAAKLASTNDGLIRTGAAQSARFQRRSGRGFTARSERPQLCYRTLKLLAFFIFRQANVSQFVSRFVSRILVDRTCESVTPSAWTGTPIQDRNFGEGEALRLKSLFRFPLAIPITYDFGQFSRWTYCWTFRSPLNLARVPFKTRSASMEIREVLVVAPGSATRCFRLTRWHPRRAGTGHAPKASRC